MLSRIGPKPMIQPEQLRSEEDWIEAGRTVFQQMDHLHLRTFDPAFVDAVRRGDYIVPLPDGTAANARWVPTKDGVALAFPNCSACHTLILNDHLVVHGAPAKLLQPSTGPPGPALVARAQQAQRYVTGGAPFRMGPEPVGMWLYRAYGVPWIKDDVHLTVKNMTEAEYNSLVAAGLRGGALPRWNGSLFYPAKVPDLVGIGDRKYIDHTATHLNRGIGDLMRYAALVSTAESRRFGPMTYSASIRRHQRCGDPTKHCMRWRCTCNH